MPEYRFAVARRHGRPFFEFYAPLVDDGAALSYARSLGGLHPQASLVTVVRRGRTIATVHLNRSLWDKDVGRNVAESWALIARARQILADTASAAAREA